MNAFVSLLFVALLSSGQPDSKLLAVACSTCDRFAVSSSTLTSADAQFTPPNRGIPGRRQGGGTR